MGGGGCNESVTMGFRSRVVCNSHIEELSVFHFPSAVPRPAVRAEPRKRTKLSKKTSGKQKRARPIRGTDVVDLDSSSCGETDDGEAEYSATEGECEQTLGTTGYARCSYGKATQLF